MEHANSLKLCEQVRTGSCIPLALSTCIMTVVTLALAVPSRLLTVSVSITILVLLLLMLGVGGVFVIAHVSSFCRRSAVCSAQT